MKLIPVDGNLNKDKTTLKRLVYDLKWKDAPNQLSTFTPVFEESSEYYLLENKGEIVGFGAFEFSGYVNGAKDTNNLKLNWYSALPMPTTGAFWLSMLKDFRMTGLSVDFTELMFNVPNMEHVEWVESEVDPNNKPSGDVHENIMKRCPSCTKTMNKAGNWVYRCKKSELMELFKGRKK